MNRHRLRLPVLAAALLLAAPAFADVVLTNRTGSTIRLRGIDVAAEGGTLVFEVRPGGQGRGPRAAWGPAAEGAHDDRTTAFVGQYEDHRSLSTLMITLAPGASMRFAPIQKEGAVRNVFFIRLAFQPEPGEAGETKGPDTIKEHLVYTASRSGPGASLKEQINYIPAVRSDPPLLEPDRYWIRVPRPGRAEHQLEVFSDSCCVIL